MVVTGGTVCARGVIRGEDAGLHLAELPGGAAAWVLALET